jgi:hypothetical protein
MRPRLGNPIVGWMGALLVASLSGCSFGDCLPLEHVPIRNATAAERAVVADELTRLADSVVAEVCVAAVTIGGFAKTAHQGGVYSAVTRRVSLGETADPEDLRLPLRHEVCHAVDLQNDIVRDTGKEFFRLLDPATGEDLEPPGHEPFALLCAYGASALDAADGSCIDDPDLMGLLQIRSSVYGLPSADDPADPLGLAVTFDAAAHFVDVTETVTGVSFSEASGGDLWLEVRTESPGSWKRYWHIVDPFTGDRVGAGTPSDTTLDVAAAVELPAPWETLGLAVNAKGATYALGELDVGNGVVSRALRYADESWGLVDDYCATDGSLFQLRGLLWSGSFEGLGLVSWSVLE